ncbi:MAG: pseudouridine synthase [Cytophagales bacterium]|nr:pseudouridine synthase [Cytophagales bacterium]
MTGQKKTNPDRFNAFKHSTKNIALPSRFTFPFCYTPHPLCKLAAQELQEYLEKQNEWKHNFGLIKGQSGLVIGKMFGVLVVQNSEGQLGYLAAFSGKLANSNHHSRFVPPVFDILDAKGFFLKEEEVLNGYNRRIELLEQAPELALAQNSWDEAQQNGAKEIRELKTAIKEAKAIRKLKRQELAALSPSQETEEKMEMLRRESVGYNLKLKRLSASWKGRIQEAKSEYDRLLNEIQTLKEERKQKSAQLQARIFDEYRFLNANGESKSLLKIFRETPAQQPPAGAGECAAPKLLQYAFANQLVPVAMAEFWWGASPKSEVRKHGHYYPACKGKCEPILSHMLEGLELDDNPMASNPAEGKKLPIVFEDEHLVVVNKPAEFLSVPGKQVSDSVQTRMEEKFPDAKDHMIVHRLDMSTSGLIVLAKSKSAHKHLQWQFLRRTVKKRYVALLEGKVAKNQGEICLPLRVDLNDRPRQLVCNQHGKNAHTKWRVVGRENGTTRVHFFPLTGRTHQLRVHAAHPLGLNCSIVGDDLYGQAADRLHLHAEQLEFVHPVTKETMCLTCEPPF